MSGRQDESTSKLLAAHKQSIASWAKVEMKTRDDDAGRYEQFFPKFQTDVEVHNYANEFSAFVSERALEVGCGTGRTLGTLNSKYRVGIDLSRESLLVARARYGKSVGLIQASATHLPFLPGTFDRLLCAGVLNHIPGEGQRILAIEESSRVVTRPARLVFSTQNYSWLARRQFPRETIQHNLFWHRFTPAEMKWLFQQGAGTCRARVWGMCSLPRWRVGNRMGPFGKWLDIAISRAGWLSRGVGAILLTKVDLPPETGQARGAASS